MNLILLVFLALFYLTFPVSLLSVTKNSGTSIDKISFSLVKLEKLRGILQYQVEVFPLKGSVGLKAELDPNKNINIFAKAGIGHSQKQTVSAFNYSVSASAFLHL